MFERNVDRLGFDMGSVEGLMLSHGHWDHGGAMLRALEMILTRNRGRRGPTYMHPDAIAAPDGSMRPLADVPGAPALERAGAAVVHATQSRAVLDDLFFISGEIPRVTAFETGSRPPPPQRRR